MLRWVWRILCWPVILATSVALVTAVILPRLMGATPYTVLTGSMRPDLPPGTLVVVKPVDPADIGVGTVITYQLKSGEPTVVTHRVVGQGLDDKGVPIFTTRGDANDTPDQKLVRPVQVEGEVWYSLPLLGYLNNLLTGRERQWGVYAAAAGLFGYALLSFIGAARDKRRTRTVKERADV